MNRPSALTSDSSNFKQFLDEFKATQKVENAPLALRSTNKDNELREKQLADMNKTLDKILKSLGGSKATGGRQENDKDEKITLKEELKSFVAGVKRFGQGVASVAKSPVQSARVGVKKAARVAEKAVAGFEDLLETPADYKIPSKEKSAKETIKEAKPVSVNPEADNIETPAEKMADAAEKNVEIQTQILDTVKSSLTQLVAIKDALTAPSKEDTSEPKEKKSLILDETGAPMAPSMDLNLGKGGPGKTIKPTPSKVAPTMGKVQPKPKPSMGSRIGGALKGAGKAALGAARVLGPIGAVAGAAYGAYEGTQRAGEIFGVEEGKEATTGQKVSAAIGGIADPFGLGYGDKVAKGVHSVGEKIGSFFGFGDKKKEEQPKGKITIDMGGGELKVVNPDGSYEMRGAYGVQKFDKDGKLLSETSPTIGGYSETKTASGETTRSLQGDVVSASETRDAAGNVIGKSASADLGLAKVSSVEGGGKKSMAAEVRNGTNENVILRDEVSTGSKQIQPIVANSVSTNNNTTYSSIKADPRPLHRGSALDRYSDRVAAY